MEDFPRISIREFLNHPNKWHAFWEGFTEPLTVWWRKPIPTAYYNQVIAPEHHYYRLGKAAAATTGNNDLCPLKFFLPFFPKPPNHYLSIIPFQFICGKHPFQSPPSALF